MDEMFEEIIRQFLVNNPRGNVSVIREAYAYASLIHKNQFRKVEKDKPYIIHLLRTTRYLVTKMKIADESLVAISILHDSIEDASFYGVGEKIREKFGETIYNGVKALTREPDPDKAFARKRYYEKIKTLSQELILIKLCDRIDNLNNIYYKSRNRIISETMLHLLPLAEQYYPEVAKDIMNVLNREHNEVSYLF